MWAFFMLHIPILYEDNDCIIANKAAKLLVHKTAMSNDRIFLLQILRDQLNTYLYPVHRLDRATSGAIIFAKNPKSAALLQEQIQTRLIEKKYLAIVRGHTAAHGCIDYPINVDDVTRKKEAVTYFSTLAQASVNIPSHRYPLSRFSLLSIRPLHGRRHQIRRHLDHLRHPIIGDRYYGDNKSNRILKPLLHEYRLYLHATELSFYKLDTQEKVHICAPTPACFNEGLNRLGFSFATEN
jgi:tRNA pseudouridine65 synthase